MSALYTLARLRVTQLFLLTTFVAAGLLTPQAASANTLPVGVLQEQSCGAFSVQIRGFGAGMMHSTKPIDISNRRLSYISATENCAVVQWESSTPAATQVLFAELGDEPITIDTSIDPDFGYPNASPQNNAGVASHTAILEGLEPGKAYSYRLVTRSHPTAIPNISDPYVLIAGTTQVFNPTPAPPVIPPTTPAPIIPNVPKFDAEKFPIVPQTPVEAPTKDEEATSTTTTVPAAITAADDALAGKSQEASAWNKLKALLARVIPDSERLSLSSSIGLFEKDRYIVPTLFFLGLLFLLQQFVLPAFGVSLRNPMLYWLFGAVVLTVLSAVFMFYYITLIGIALFLGLLAWYLLKSVPDAPETKQLAIVKDNLKKIEGIGPKIEELLNKGGITSFTDLKNSKASDLKAILKRGGEKFQIHDPQTWPEQASLAAQGKWSELQRFQKDLQGGKR